MSATDIAAVIEDLKLKRFSLSAHALQRMSQRSVTEDDIQSVGETVTGAAVQPNGRIRVDGTDLDGDALAVVCAYDGDTLIVTVLEDS